MSNDYGAFNERVGYQNLPATGVKTAATGIPTIILDPDDGNMDNTTLDLAIAATSGITGDKALNYGTVQISAGAISTGNCTLTLGDGLRVGQVVEFKIAGAVTGYFLVITITNVVDGQSVFNLNSINDTLLVRWNGSAWQVISGRTAQFSNSTTSAADSLEIPVTARYVAKTTGGDAEALTLADGSFDGQLLTISLVVDGNGTGTLTPATCTGFTTIAFADAGDTVTLEFVNPTLGWMIRGAYGVAAPPAVAIT